MESRANGAYRRADCASNLFHREVAVVAEDDSDPMIRAEGREGAPDGVTVIDGEMGVIRGRCRSCSIQIVVASDLPPPEPIAAGVDEDPREPCVEPIGIAELFMLMPSSKERVVGRIFRLLCVAEDEARQPVRVVKACLDQLLERGSPCSLGIRRQGPTGVAQLTLSNSGPSPVPTHQEPRTFNRSVAALLVTSRC